MQAGWQPFGNSLGDDVEERQLKQLLNPVFFAPPMRDAFVDRLSQNLDAEFMVSGMPNAATIRNCVSHDIAAVPVQRVRRRPLPKLMATAAVAAIVLFSLLTWENRPAYGWATMLEALESCQWVQAITRNETGDGDAAAIGWFSNSARVAAREEGESRVYLNFDANTIEIFDPAANSILQRTVQSNDQLANEFLALLLSKGGSGGFKVVNESLSEVLQGGAPVLRLLVSLRSPPNSGIVTLEFLIDPKTQLPISGMVLNGKGQASETAIEFSYPKHGPESIYALGVPADATLASAMQVAGEAAPQQSIAATTSRGETPETSMIVEEWVIAGDSSVPAEFEGHGLIVDGDDGGTILPAADPAPLGPEPGTAAPMPLEPTELVEQINGLLTEYWGSQGITPAKPAGDSEFLRRVYLDLIGRIPTVSEVYEFLENSNPDRREQLIDDLLSSRDHATHLAAVWRAALLPEGIDLNAYGGTNKFDRWLADRFAQNLPYDQIVRQLLLAEGRVSDSGPILFYASLKLNPEEIAAKTSRVFLGTRMECAQCHDHPFDDRIAQTDFWGFAAHFAQISRPQGRMEMTSPVLRVRDNTFGEVTLPESDKVILPRLPVGTGGDNDPATDRSGIPVSRRQKLVDWLTNENNVSFARATVNRVWQQLYGRGLVEPVDDLRPDNKAVCPEVLELLTRDFAASGFDLRRLLRGLVLTDAYQLSSTSTRDDPSQAMCFARMNMKYFTADQLYDCIAVATRSAGLPSGSADGALARTENASREQFIELFRTAAGDRTDYQAGVAQALTLMHGSVVHSATDLAASGLLKSLNAPFFTDEQRLETLFLSTLSREPSVVERDKLLGYLKEAEDLNEKFDILSDVLWALLNSAEFAFIH